MADTVKKPTKKKGVIMHFKPTYDFQTIEFDYEYTPENEEKIIELLDRCYQMMMATAPTQPDTKKTVVKKAFEPKATIKQLNYLKNLGAKVSPDITAAEASQLIKQLKEQGEPEF